MAVATEMGVEVDIVPYLKEPPDEATLREIVSKLEDPVENLVRKDAHFTKLGLDENAYVDDPDAVVEVLVEHPRLMQRPVLVRDDKAIIGRPLGDRKARERVVEFLEGR